MHIYPSTATAVADGSGFTSITADTLIAYDNAIAEWTSMVYAGGTNTTLNGNHYTYAYSVNELPQLLRACHPDLAHILRTSLQQTYPELLI